MQDFSEYLVGDKLVKEETDWARTKHYEVYVSVLEQARKLFKLPEAFTLLEVGCGSGWVPTMLSDSITYYGIDKSPELIELARQKNKESRKFVQVDFRHFWPTATVKTHMVCSFAVLKHFGLHEWRDIFRRMLALAPYGVFSIQDTEGTPYDDGTEYHHIWVSDDMIWECVRAERMRVFQIDRLKKSGYDTFFYIGREQ